VVSSRFLDAVSGTALAEGTLWGVVAMPRTITLEGLRSVEMADK